MIHAGMSELRRAFHTHRGAIPNSSPSQYLLLFYAAECGLKALWLRRHQLRTSEDFPEDAARHGHDLLLWVKNCGFRQTLLPRGADFTSGVAALNTTALLWRTKLGATGSN